MKFSFSSFLTKLTLTASVASVLVGCDEPEYATPTPVTESTVGQARVLVVNAAPGATGTAVTVDNASFGTALPYLGASAITPIAAGLRLFIFNEPTNIPSNAPAGSAARPLVSRTSFLGGTNYTVFLTDPTNRALIGTTDQGGIRSLVLTDNLAAPAAGNAKVRFVNLAPSGTYGIFNGATSFFPAAPLRGFRALNSGTTAPVTTYANFTEVAAGTYNLDVRSVATTPLAGTAQSLTFTAGKIYTLYVRGVAASATPTATSLGISVVQHN
ncbi:DUF4397 domain-containing protein [Hymenobacter sp. BT186]|uniref:DUF4397 domain-containing protein n=1 Tax=Hymenobacter telluris TaxID=2816474 RepID=A0A939JBK9_9BACT|nr:DUF4397 domain-containing protein [Hymenobacter telluris]MBO0357400.1 DUF4397 domain-containing protein [Hymenobacter telluris]MBW3373426.1 DUF4397 domain-containing protein [Hymenobacter norwichensis]